MTIIEENGKKYLLENGKKYLIVEENARINIVASLRPKVQK